jgi:hypothetical protein
VVFQNLGGLSFPPANCVGQLHDSVHGEQS